MTTKVDSRTMFTRVQARKAEDALLELARSPDFAGMTRPEIAEHLASAVGFGVTAANVKTLARTVGVNLPMRPSGGSKISARLQHVEDAVSFVLKNWAQQHDRGVLDQLAIVRELWFASHPV